jgi:hypothetical protein
MDASIINHLENFFDDIGFPVNKHQLIEESQDWPLPDNVREALALLPEQEYSTREEIMTALTDVPFDDGIPKKHAEDDIDVDDHMDNLVDLDEFTQMGDEEDHESV